MGAGVVRDLAIAAGPAADGIIINSRRLLDADGLDDAVGAVPVIQNGL
jgi:hypothetical protein